jgi:NADH:ubiquinone oxidoreductase subunit 6 (subunit J)
MDPQTTQYLYSIMFWIVAILTGLSAISVVVTQNIVRAAVWLLFSLAGTAGLFFLLGADFVGSTQLIVYVGGTLVLVVFGVMLTAQGPFITMRTGAAEWAIATIVGLLFLGVLSVSLWNEFNPQKLKEEHAFGPTTGQPLKKLDPGQSMSSVMLGQSLIGVTEATPRAKLTGLPPEVPAADVPARTAMNYLLPFEIVSVHLLVVLIGAAYLARAKRRRMA